jgi:hypothetical protein
MLDPMSQRMAPYGVGQRPYFGNLVIWQEPLFVASVLPGPWSTWLQIQKDGMLG